VQRFSDEETRRAVRLAHAEALEADNFGEEEREPLVLEGSGLYLDDSGGGGGGAGAGAGGGVRDKGASKRKKAGGAAAGAGGPLSDAQRRLVNARGHLRRVEEVAAWEAGSVTDETGRLVRNRRGAPLFSVAATSAAQADPPYDGAGTSSLRDTGVEAATGNTAPWAEAAHHFLASAARPARLPAVPFCGVCGARGKYACTRCGSYTCSIGCRKSHSETRCQK
jgi:hypothetical protein